MFEVDGCFITDKELKGLFWYSYISNTNIKHDEYAKYLVKIQEEINEKNLTLNKEN